MEKKNVFILIFNVSPRCRKNKWSQIMFKKVGKNAQVSGGAQNHILCTAYILYVNVTLHKGPPRNSAQSAVLLICIRKQRYIYRRLNFRKTISNRVSVYPKVAGSLVFVFEKSENYVVATYSRTGVFAWPAIFDRLIG